MGFMENLQDAVNKGVDVSKDLFSKASEKAKELGDKGILNYEILQLNNQAQNQAAKIGTWVYQKLQIEKGSVHKDDSTLVALLAELQRLHQEIETRHKKLEELGK